MFTNSTTLSLYYLQILEPKSQNLKNSNSTTSHKILGLWKFQILPYSINLGIMKITNSTIFHKIWGSGYNDMDISNSTFHKNLGEGKL